MRFQEYLIAEALTLDKKAEIIKRECEPFLSQVDKNNFLFKHSSPEYVANFKKFAPIKTSEERSAIINYKEMQDVVNAIDAGFKNVFNTKLHANCLWCNVNKDDVRKYRANYRYVILPVGKFNTYICPLLDDKYILGDLDLYYYDNDDKIKLFDIYLYVLKRRNGTYPFNNEYQKGGGFEFELGDGWFDRTPHFKLDVLDKYGIKQEPEDVLAKLKDKSVDLAAHFVKKYYKKVNIKEAFNRNSRNVYIDCDKFYIFKYRRNNKTFDVWDKLL